MKEQQNGKGNSEKDRNNVKRLSLPNFSYQGIVVIVKGLTDRL